jgi:hypothetical protein
MNVKSPIWQPVAIGLSAINLVAVGFAAAGAEAWHAAVHAGVALGFGLWAQRLRQRPPVAGRVAESGERFDLLEAEVAELRRELTETQERMDFAERVLAQRPEPPRVGPER